MGFTGEIQPETELAPFVVCDGLYELLIRLQMEMKIHPANC